MLPAMLLLVAAGMQFALYGLAAHAVDELVAEGGATGRSALGGIDDARAILRAETRQLSQGLIQSPHVTVTESAGDEVLVTMSASVPSLLPGVHLTVRASSGGPAQEFRPGA